MRRQPQEVLSIQRASMSDVVAMHNLQMRAFEEEGRRCGTREIQPLQETTDSIAEHVNSHIALVAKENGVLIGCVRGVHDDRAWTIRALVVEPSKHGQGIGSALLQALESEIGSEARIELTTNTIMNGNVAFYEHHGYHIVKRSVPIAGVEIAHLVKLPARDV